MTTRNKINIITYNVLSSTLADLMQSEIKNNVKVYPSSVISNDVRWKKISDNIIRNIREKKQNLIFCLQEVTEDWLPMFASLFSRESYKYISVQHGRVFNGNMGVLIAYPSNLEIAKSEFYCVGKHVVITDEASQKSASKTNTAILVLFEDLSINFKFGIVNYHMPCEPSIPEIGLTHSKILYKKTIRFMENNSWIFSGDFNMTPDTRGYKYLSDNAKCIWRDRVGYYPITNHAYIKGYEFSGCLDYIFYSSNLECSNVIFSELKNIIPDEKEPSDHIPIQASFQI